jgi:hypothetical protein
VHATHAQHMVPRGLEPRTLRLLAVRSNQLSYETVVLAAVCRMCLPARLWWESCCQLARHNVLVGVYGRCWGCAPSCRQSLCEVLAEEARRFVAARLAQPAERKALNLVVVGSSPTVGVFDWVCEGGKQWCSKRAPREARTPDLEVNGLTL